MLLDSIGSVVPGLKNPEGSLFLHQIAWAKGPTKPIKGFWEQKDTESCRRKAFIPESEGGFKVGQGFLAKSRGSPKEPYREQVTPGLKGHTASSCPGPSSPQRP